MKKGFELLQKRGRKLVSKGLKKEHEKQRAWRVKSSFGGKKSAERRWGNRLQDKGGTNGAYKKKQPKGNTTSTTPTVVDFVRLRNAAPPGGGGGAAGLRKDFIPAENKNILGTGGGLVIRWDCPLCKHVTPSADSPCGVCGNSSEIYATAAGREALIELLYKEGVLVAQKRPQKNADPPKLDSRGEYLGKYGTAMIADKLTEEEIANLPDREPLELNKIPNEPPPSLAKLDKPKQGELPELV